MIVSELVLHHSYSRGVAFDLSEHGNHGALQGVGVSGGNVVFGGGSDAVRVKASPSLRDLRGIRTQVTFKITPGPTPHRHNLIEGYICFALVVNGDYSLQGTIVNLDNAWDGALSPPGIVSPNTWHTATFLHDGFSTAKLWLDGVLVAENYNVMGPVVSVANPYGIAIGHWPDPDDRYTLEGEISEVKVWKSDPTKIRDAIDDCCIDRGSIDDIIHRAHQDGFYKPELDSVARDLLNLGQQMVGKFSGPDQASRDHARDVAKQATLAFTLGDGPAFRQLLADTAAEVAAKVPAAEITADTNELLGIMDRTPAGPVIRELVDLAMARKLDPSAPLPDEVAVWADALCLDWAVPPRRPPKGRDPKGGHEDPKDPKDPKHPRPVGEDPPGEGWGEEGGQHEDPPETGPNDPPPDLRRGPR